MLTITFERIIYMKINIYFHVNNSLECSYKKLKGHLSAAYLLSLMSVKGIGKILPPFFLYFY